MVVNKKYLYLKQQLSTNQHWFAIYEYICSQKKLVKNTIMSDTAMANQIHNTIKNLLMVSQQL